MAVGLSSPRGTLLLAVLAFTFHSAESQLYVLGGGTFGLPSINLTAKSDVDHLCIGQYNTAWLDPVPPRLPHAAAYFGTAAVASELYVVGGTDGRRPLDSTLRYGCGEWTEMAGLNLARSALAVATDGEELVYALGGTTTDGPTNASEVFNVTSARWSPLPPMRRARTSFGAAVIDSLVYVAGGSLTMSELAFTWSNCTATDEVEVYSPVLNRWTQLAPLLHARCAATLSAAGGKLYAIGGIGSERQLVGVVEQYDPATGVWTALQQQLAGQRYDHAAVVMGTDIYLTGGRGTAGLLRSTTAFSIASLRSAIMTTMISVSRAGVGAAALSWDCAVMGRNCGQCPDGCAAHGYVECGTCDNSTEFCLDGMCMVASTGVPRGSSTTQSVAFDTTTSPAPDTTADAGGGTSYFQPTTAYASVPAAATSGATPAVRATSAASAFPAAPATSATPATPSFTSALGTTAWSALYPSQPAQCGRFDFRFGVVFEAQAPFTHTSLPDCCALCRNQSACAAFSWIGDEGVGVCFTYTQTDGPVRSLHGAVTAVYAGARVADETSGFAGPDDPRMFAIVAALSVAVVVIGALAMVFYVARRRRTSAFTLRTRASRSSSFRLLHEDDYDVDEEHGRARGI